MYLMSSIIFRGFFLTQPRDTSRFLPQRWTRLELKESRSIRGWERVKAGIVYFDVVEYEPLVAVGIVLSLVIFIHNLIISNETTKYINNVW